jgi:2',3'-cyclic-nucleotide 2'-phosphodiesterase (5'-nucleotidase family)
MAPLTLLQTSDLHNHIGLAQAGRLRTLRLEHEALLLDCGDAIWAGNVFVKLGPEHAIRRMNEAGYSAMAMGNREFFFRASGLLMKTIEARFPVVSANLLPRSGDLGHVRRWAILESPQGSRVGVFGLTPTMIRPESWVEMFSDLRFISHERAVREALAALRETCEWVVCLSHIGFPADCELAEQFGEIDVILGGHSHLTLPEAAVVNGVTISHVGAYAKQVALLRSGGETRPSGFSRELLELP